MGQDVGQWEHRVPWGDGRTAPAPLLAWTGGPGGWQQGGRAMWGGWQWGRWGRTWRQHGAGSARAAMADVMHPDS